VIGSGIDAALPGLTDSEQELIERAEVLGRGMVAANATAVDRGMLPLKGHLTALAEAGLAGVDVPPDCGGSGVRQAAELRILEALAYGDGTTPFVIAQHYGTCLMLTVSSNAILREAMLPLLARGDLWAGFGISHVRREGRPVLAAVPDGRGYRFDGMIPWITGYGLFDYIIIAGTLPDGQTVSAWVRLQESPHIRFSPPMELVAMNAAQTVSATVEGLVVEPDEVVDIGPNALRGRPNAPTVPCLFGLTRACIDDLAALAARRGVAASARAAETFGTRLHHQRLEFYALMSAQPRGDSTPALSRARAAATRLALDAAGALIVAGGGGSNALANPAQRRLREASVFATWGLSSDSIDEAVTAFADRQ
jgi:alkylation response protein AidB-like acyl-CoA dehydrogenase